MSALNPRNSCWRFTAIWPKRANRVRVLLALILLLNAFDLHMTLEQMATNGMFEDNPIVAQLVQQTGSAGVIIAYKLLTVVIGVSLLFWLRRTLAAEVGSALVVVILIGLTVQWFLYLQCVGDLGPADLTELRHQFDWVRLG